MIAEQLRHLTEIPLSIVGMFIFVVTFLGTTVWILLSGQNIDELARMPLREEEIIHE